MWEDQNNDFLFVPPSDIAIYFRQYKPGKWAFVCPVCKNCFPVAIMQGFRDHLRAIDDCDFKPKEKKSTIDQKVKNFPEPSNQKRGKDGLTPIGSLQ